MKTLIIVALAVVSVAMLNAGQPQFPTNITVRELPPEDFPKATCKDSRSGYLEITETDGHDRTALTNEEIGKYVKERIAEGMSVDIYPQLSGRMFVIATCHTNSHAE